jgi:hypothetical protein
VLAIIFYHYLTAANNSLAFPGFAVQSCCRSSLHGVSGGLGQSALAAQQRPCRQALWKRRDWKKNI